MPTLTSLLTDFDLHDSCLESLETSNTGRLSLFIDFDRHWLTTLNPAAVGIVIPKLFQITRLDQDTIWIIGSTSCETLDNLHEQWASKPQRNPASIVKCTIEFVTGARFEFVCENIARLLIQPLMTQDRE